MRTFIQLDTGEVCPADLIHSGNFAEAKLRDSNLPVRFLRMDIRTGEFWRLRHALDGGQHEFFVVRPIERGFLLVIEESRVQTPPFISSVPALRKRAYEEQREREHPP